jgi:RNA polymerase sigma-70 factor (ECF subfamily)
MYKEIQKSFLYNQEVLIQEFNKGSNTAFEFVFRTNYKALSYYAYGQVGCKMTAEDIVQSVFINLWKNKNQFNSIYALKSFLYISVRNGCLDEKKRMSSASNIRAKYIKNRSLLSETDLADILDAETLGILYNSIYELPPVCRRIMLMSLAGKKNFEISESLNISVNTVRAHKQKAILKLRKILPPELQALILIITLCEIE